MADVAILVEGLSKRYRIGLKEELPDTLVGAVAQALKRPLRNWRRLRRLNTFRDDRQRGPGERRVVTKVSTATRAIARTLGGSDVAAPSLSQASDIVWALRDVSFDVERGEVVGILGRNGAGKSTLLKILSGITHPTLGRAEIRGRVGSLLEVGTGFHPELTGRENIYLNGTILGMTRQEIDRNLDRIMRFANVGRFIDTPVKRYSSGMRVRLAFSVAAHLSPEILLVDEVLAVGDIGFQRKCLGKMEEVSTSGRTVLFVSHNLAMIEALCSRVIMLQDGRKAGDGPASKVITAYMEALRVDESSVLADRADRQGTGEIQFVDVEVLGHDGTALEHVRSGEDCLLSIGYECADGDIHSGVTFGASFYSRGAHLFSVNSRLKGRVYDDLARSGRVSCRIPQLPLAPGVYQYNLICRIRGTVSDWITDAGELVVVEGDFFGSGQLPPDSHSGALVDHTWFVEGSD